MVGDQIQDQMGWRALRDSCPPTSCLPCLPSTTLYHWSILGLEHNASNGCDEIQQLSMTNQDSSIRNICIQRCWDSFAAQTLGSFQFQTSFAAQECSPSALCQIKIAILQQEITQEGLAFINIKYKLVSFLNATL